MRHPPGGKELDERGGVLDDFVSEFRAKSLL